MKAHRTRPAPPLHLVPMGERILNHTPTSLCWCHPIQTYRDLSTMAPAFLHTNEPRPRQLTLDSDGAA